MTPVDIRLTKGKKRLVVLTAFDAPTAAWCEAGGVDIILVGDSFGMTSLGMKDTTTVTMDMMVVAVESVCRGLSEKTTDPASLRPLVVADMPLEGFRDIHTNAERLCGAGADAVKIECHAVGIKIIRYLTSHGIEVMAHVGLLPQEIKKLGGYKLQGETDEEAERIISDAKLAEDAGAFCCVIEKVPAILGRRITEALTVPTIGIGAGISCDGQVLVLYDILGIQDRFRPRFVRRYANFGRDAVRAVTAFAEDVRTRKFPAPEESFE